MNKELSLPILENSEFDAELLIYAIEMGSYIVDWQRIETKTAFEQALKERQWDLIIVNYMIPEYSGITALKLINQKYPDTPALMISDSMGEDHAVEAMRSGANDYFVKGNYSRLVPAITRELREARSRRAKKDVDAALHESEEQYRTLIEKTPIATAVYREEGILYINPACQKLLGAEKLEDVIQLSPLDFVHQDDKSMVRARAMQAWHEFLPPQEQRIVRLDGEIIEVEVVSGPILYQGKKAVIVTLLDISERNRSREIIRRRAMQLRVAAEVARDATAAREVEELLNRSALLIQERFNFYHAGIFLIDAQRKYAYLAASPGEAGRKLLEQGHQLAVGKVGIVGHVAGTGKSRIALDVGEDAIHFKQPLLPDTRSEMALPLKVDGRVIGVLDVQSQQEAAFDDEDVQMLQIMADQLDVAIDKANLFSEAQRRAHELSVLYDTALATSSELDENILFQRLYEQVDKFLKPDSFLIAIYDDLNQEFEIRFAMEIGSEMKAFLNRRFPIDNGGLTGWVIRNRKSLYMNDITQGDLPDTPIPAYQDWQNTHSWLGIPLIVKDRILGVLSIQSFLSNAFSEEQKKFLETLTNQAAIALDNANLFETIDKRAAELETERRHLSLLYEVGKVLTSSLDPDEILEQAAILTCTAIDGMNSIAFYFDQSTQSLFPTAIYDHEKKTLLKEISNLPIGEGLAGWVAREQRSAIVPDVRKDQRWRSVFESSANVRAAISAPIFDGKKVLGTLSVHHRQVNAFSEDHRNLLDAICQQVTLALSNARRYQEINRLVDRLGAQQYRLESIIKELPIGVVLLDERKHILSANTLGQEYLELLAPDQTETEIYSIGSYPITQLLSFQDDLLPFEIATEESPARRFEVQARIVIGGTTQEFLLTIRDVTREREIQERIHMQERLATVGQLAAGIAHDFNNIMAAIVIYADLLRTDITLSSNSREHLGIIQQQVQRASSLIRQILDFSRRSVIDPTEMELLPFLKEIEKLLIRMLPETIQTTLVYEPGAYRIFADPTRFQQVVMNLAVNARDAMPNGGTLRFELDHFQQNPDEQNLNSFPPPGNWIRLSTQDSGMGIHPTDLPHIFEPFFTTKDVGKGTGLGLAQVYGIVKQHGGYIDVSSQINHGTTFYIFLPQLVEDIEVAADDVIPHIFDGAGKAVLLVEDDAATRSAVQAMLEACKFDVLTAINGLDAVKKLEETRQSIDLIISDVVMPGMGGVGLFEFVGDHYPDMKMLFITGHPLEGKAHDLLSRSDVAWLQKPFSMQDFQNVLSDMLTV